VLRFEYFGNGRTCAENAKRSYSEVGVTLSPTRRLAQYIAWSQTCPLHLSEHHLTKWTPPCLWHHPKDGISVPELMPSFVACARPSLAAHESESMLRTYLICREQRERERERERKKERERTNGTGRSTQCTNNSDPITSTSGLLLRQNSVTAHAHQS
jgi:hypothetical protein